MSEYRPRPIANPAPLGLCGFALTTFVLSLVNTGIGTNVSNIVCGLAFFYGGCVQICAGMWEFRCGNLIGATAFSSYGGFWVSFAATLTPAFKIEEAYKDEFNVAMGYYLLGWMIFTMIMMFGSLRGVITMFLLFFFLFITFLLLTIGSFANAPECNKAAGWFGFITALIAWYNAASVIITKESSYVTLPVGQMKIPHV